MSTETMALSDRERRLEAILVAYLEAAERSQPPSRQMLLEQYPDFAADLTEFLDNQKQVERLAGPLRLVVEAARLSLARMPTRGAEAVIPVEAHRTVRYFGDYELLERIAEGGM